MENKTNAFLVAIVAIVAVTGLVISLTGGSNTGLELGEDGESAIAGQALRMPSSSTIKSASSKTGIASTATLFESRNGASCGRQDVQTGRTENTVKKCCAEDDKGQCIEYQECKQQTVTCRSMESGTYSVTGTMYDCEPQECGASSASDDVAEVLTG